MLQWIAEKWLSDWVGNVVWWQSVAGVLQGIFAVLLYKATIRTIELSQEMAESAKAQTKIQKQSQRLFLYERRLKLYQSTLAFLNNYSEQQGQIGHEAFNNFKQDLTEGPIILPQEIVAFVDAIRDSVERLKFVRSAMLHIGFRQKEYLRVFGDEEWIISEVPFSPEVQAEEDQKRTYKKSLEAEEKQILLWFDEYSIPECKRMFLDLLRSDTKHANSKNNGLATSSHRRQG